MKKNSEYENFNRTMDLILKANPQAVKQAMEADKKARERKRKAKPASSSHALIGKS